MKKFVLVALLCLSATISSTSLAQEAPGEGAAPPRTAEDIVEKTKTKVKQIAEKVDQDQRAQEAAAGILQHILKLAQFLSFPAFYWLAFAAMIAGAVSFSLQLVLAKLIVLTKMSLSLREVISDALGLVISLIGMLLTTQAAAQNSTFTQSSAAVLSATAAGVVVGFVLYLWGQRQEIEAVSGRRPSA